MDVNDSLSSIWQEIELSESYLVCSMYEEAVPLSSSVIKCVQQYKNDARTSNSTLDEIVLHEMLESAVMVLVQSLNQLGRASEIVKELKSLFVSAAAVPVQVLLTGVCFQISDGSALGVQGFLEEFLGSWSYVDGQYYILVCPDTDLSVQERCDRRYILEIDEYMGVVEVYAVTLLGATLKDLDHAISWVQKATLPNERQQTLDFEGNAFLGSHCPLQWHFECLISPLAWPPHPHAQ